MKTFPSDTRLKSVGYVLWLFGFTGSHRFYYGKQITGTIWFFTLGLLGIGWLIDVFLIPGMDREADFRYRNRSRAVQGCWMISCGGGWFLKWASMASRR